MIFVSRMANCVPLVLMLVVFECGEAQDRVVERGQVLEQTLLWNSWRNRIGSDAPNAPGIPVEWILQSVLGHGDKQSFSSAEISTASNRFDEWLTLLSHSRFATSSGAKATNDLATLSKESVGLHFAPVNAHVNYAELFRDHSRLYEQLAQRLNDIETRVESLDKQVFKSPTEKSGDVESLKNALADSPEVRRQLNEISEHWQAIEKDSLNIGYPISCAREIQTSAKDIKKTLAEMKSPDYGKATFGMQQAGLGYISQRVKDLHKLCTTSKFHSAQLAEGFRQMPPNLDPSMLALVYGMAVPLEDPKVESVQLGIKSVETWLTETGLSPGLKLDQVLFTFPFKVHFALSCTDEFESSLKSYGGDVNFNDRLFYKLTSTFRADPAATTISVNSGQCSFFAKWNNGELEGGRTCLASATMGAELGSKEFKKALGNLKYSSKSDIPGAKLLTDPLRVIVCDFLKDFGGRVVVVRDDSSFLLVRVNNARNMVVVDENLWEDVDLNMIVVPGDKKVSLLCVIDGRWAKGILPPSSTQAYRDMEPAYAKHLSDFAGRIVVHVKDQLLSSAVPKKPTTK